MSVGELLLPRTDAGVLIQLGATVIVGVPLVVALLRRRLTDLVWFVGGGLVLLIGIFGLRAVR